MSTAIRPATAADAALLASLNADVQAIHAQAMPWWFEAMVEAVREAAAERGIALLALDVWSSNDGARAFFRRQGFATYNERMWNRQEVFVVRYSGVGVSALFNATLLIIDVQKAIDAAYHAPEGPRNNPDAESNIAKLLAAWRRAQRPIVHVRHDSTFASSAYRPGQPGNEFKPQVAPMAGETIIAKKTNSAFIGTELERYLHDGAIDTLVVTGVATNNSVEATVRMAGNLGFSTYLVEDGCFTFARRDYRGRLRTADEVHAMSLANLDREYCTVTTTDEVLATLVEKPSILY